MSSKDDAAAAADDDGCTMTTPLHVACAKASLERVQHVLASDATATINALIARQCTPLMIACQRQQQRQSCDDKDTCLKIVECLLQHGANPNLGLPVEHRPLWNAIRNNQTNVAELLLQHGANVHDVDEKTGETLLHVACQNPGPFGSSISTQNVKLVLSHGAAVNVLDAKSCSPLHHAVQAKHVAKVNLLLEEYGADPNIESTHESKKDTPLHTACFLQHQAMVTLLLQHGADANATNQRGWTPLVYAIHIQSLDILQILLQDYHANPNIPTTDTQETSLHKACWRNNVVMANLLLQHGANVNARDVVGRAPLHCVYDQLDIVQLLVEQHGAAMDAADNAGETALFYCIRHDVLDTAQYLLTAQPKEASVDLINQDGLQVLHVACTLGNLEAVQLLVDEGGANVHAATTTTQTNNQLGLTPLHLACQEGSEDVMAYLLDQGADPNCICSAGQTALHLAANSGRMHVVHLLIQHGAAVDALTHREQQTALHLASAKGYLAIVSLLLHAGADTKAVNAAGGTAFDVACENCHLGVLYFFLREHNWMANLLVQQ